MSSIPTGEVPAWIPALTSLGGVVLGGTLSMIQQALAWRRQKRGQTEERQRKAAEMAERFRIESDAASFRRIEPLLDELEHQWNRLGGGPGPQAGAVAMPGPDFDAAAGAFEKANYQIMFLDDAAGKMVRDIYMCTRNFAMHSGILAMYQQYPPHYANEIFAEQEARKELTGQFRSLYDSLKRYMTSYVGTHRLFS